MGKGPIFRQILVALPAFVNSMVFGLSIGWMPVALHMIKSGETEFELTFTECSWMASLADLGRLIIAVPGGIFTDKVGRRNVSYGIGTLQFVCWTVLSCTNKIAPIFVARFLLGILAGLLNTVNLAYLAEVASAEYRGIFVAMNSLSFFVGVLFEGCFGIIATYDTIMVATAFLTTLFFPMAWWLIDTPSFLISKGRIEEAETRLRWLRCGRPEEEVTEELFALKCSIENEKKVKINYLQMLNLKGNRRSLYLVCSINFLTTVSGNAVISTYITFLLPPNDLVPTSSYPAIFVVIQVTAVLCSMLVIDKVKRRTFFIVSVLVHGLLLLIAGTLTFVNDTLQVPIQYYTWLFIGVNALSVAVYAFSVSPLTSSIRAELLSQRIKGFGAGVSVISQAVASFINLMLFHIINENIGLYGNYVIYFTSCIITAINVYLYLPEGKGKTLAEIQEILNASKKVKYDVKTKL